MAHETRRLLEAAAALHSMLLSAGVPHAFHGSFVVALLANAPSSEVCSYRLSHDHNSFSLFNSKRYFVFSMEEALIRFAELDKLAQGMATLLPGHHLGLTGE